MEKIVRNGFVHARDGYELWVNTETDEMVKFVVKDWNICKKFYCQNVKVTIEIIDDEL